jgi:hypothetical protein
LSRIIHPEVNYLFAYIDAGSGSLLLQLLVGGVAGLAAFFRFRWGRIRQRLSRRAEAEDN